MEKPNELTDYDFRDTLQVPSGYDLETIPDLTRDNFRTLIDEHNKLVKAFHALSEYTGFDSFVNYDED